MSRDRRGKSAKSGKNRKSSSSNRHPNQIRVFVATPGDVSTERGILRELLEDFDLMFDGLETINIRFVGGETIVPSLGRAQESINKNLRRADIFVGIMWNRFGSDTGKFESGTEEEFKVAFDLWKERGVPWVIFYFSDVPSALNSAEETDQRKKVLAFKKTIQLVIFDVSDLSPNVMIEIGIRSRHAPFILLTRNIESLPFFLKTYHCLVYEPTVAGINNAIPELADLIRKTLAPKNKVVAKEDYQVHELAM